MECDLGEVIPLTKLIVGLLVTGSVIIFTLVALAILCICPHLDPQLRDVLFSYQVANLVGCCLITYETVSSSCIEKQLGLIGVSLLLSLSHFGILLVCEYDDLTSNPRVYIEPMRGLIFFSWLVSASFGALLPTTTNVQPTANVEGEIVDNGHHLDRTKACLAVVTLIMLVFMYVFLRLVILPKQHARDTYLYWQKFMFDTSHRTHIHTFVFTVWKTGYFHIMMLCYALFTLPWLVQQFYEGFGYKRIPKHVDYALLIVYSLNFYALPIVCIEMWKNRRGESIMPNQDSPRMDNHGADISSEESLNRPGCSKNARDSSLRESRLETFQD